MPKIIFIGPALVDSGEDNNDGTISLVEDRAILKSLDGLQYDDEEFSDYLADSEETASISDRVSGGILRFEYKENQELLVGKIEYQVNGDLSSDEVESLKEYTIEQLLDGIGSNFSQERVLNGELAPFINHEDLVFEQAS